MTSDSGLVVVRTRHIFHFSLDLEPYFRIQMASHTELSRLSQLMKIEDVAMQNQLKEAVSRFLTSVFTSPKLMVLSVVRNYQNSDDILRHSNGIHTETMTLHRSRLQETITDTLFI